MSVRVCPCPSVSVRACVHVRPSPSVSVRVRPPVPSVRVRPLARQSLRLFLNPSDHPSVGRSVVCLP
eukprot:13250213-Alexandrium_andersonii.AAC.1